MMSAAPAWTISHLGTFTWQSWDDDEIVVYHSASGATHVLTPPAAAVIQELEQSDLRQEEIVERVAKTLDCDSDEHFTDQVRQLLEEFDQLGLIEPT